jgi:hypothetical protein
MPSTRPSSTARVLSIGAAAVLAIVSTALLAAGALSLWGDSQRDADGYISTDREHVSTTAYALASDDLDINSDAPDWLLDGDDLGTVRLAAQSRDGKPVFVGVARTSDVERYLSGTAYTTVADFDTSPFRADYDEHAGTGRPVAPAERPIWDASVQGGGHQRLDWDAKPGNWSVVVMNADGSRGVDTTVSAGAKLSFLQPLGWAAIGGGVVLMLAAGGLLYLGLRPPRVPPVQPAQTPVAA